MKMQGYNGSQLWDTAFAVLALAEVNLMGATCQSLARAHRYIDNTQARKDPQS